MVRIIFLFIFFLYCFSSFAGEKKIIIAGNRMVKSLVDYIVKDKYFVYCPVSANICPGHYSYKISDVVNAEKSIAVFYNGYEVWIKELIRKRNLENKKRKIVEIKDELMIPEKFKKNARLVCNVLCEIDEKNRKYFEDNYEKLLFEIKNTVKNLKKFEGEKVACSLYQKDFAEWLGLDTVCIFSVKDSKSPAGILSFIEKCRKSNVVLIIENRQSSFHLGEVLKKELKVKCVYLSNFPSEKESYIDLLTGNYKKIKDALFLRNNKK